MRSETYQAAHDVLAIVRLLQGPFQGVTLAETHLVAYLACLLSLYRGHAADDWGYDFVRSQWGAPFAVAVAEAVAPLQARGYLLGTGTTLTATEPGATFSEFLGSRVEHEWRLPYLSGASGSVLALPVGVVRAALREEPSLRQANLHPGPRPLLAESGVDALHEQFQALSEAIGMPVDDVLVPAVVWLTYLTEVRRGHPIEAGERDNVGSAPTQ